MRRRMRDDAPQNKVFCRLAGSKKGVRFNVTPPLCAVVLYANINFFGLKGLWISLDSIKCQLHVAISATVMVERTNPI